MLVGCWLESFVHLHVHRVAHIHTRAHDLACACSRALIALILYSLFSAINSINQSSGVLAPPTQDEGSIADNMIGSSDAVEPLRHTRMGMAL